MTNGATQRLMWSRTNEFSSTFKSALHMGRGDAAIVAFGKAGNYHVIDNG
jgi:hypothetical protein